MDRIEQALSEAEQKDAFRWLDSKCNNPSALHNSTFEKYEEHTVSWLHEWEEWDSWLRSEATPKSCFLWIHGIPGSGKSVLASFAIESIKSHCQDLSTIINRRRLGYVYYYCHYSHKEDEGSPFLRWVIAQLGRQAQWAQLSNTTLPPGARKRGCSIQDVFRCTIQSCQWKSTNATTPTPGLCSGC